MWPGVYTESVESTATTLHQKSRISRSDPGPVPFLACFPRPLGTSLSELGASYRPWSFPPGTQLQLLFFQKEKMLGLGKCGHPDSREGWEHAPRHCLGLSQLWFSRAQFRRIPG